MTVPKKSPVRQAPTIPKKRWLKAEKFGVRVGE